MRNPTLRLVTELQRTFKKYHRQSLGGASVDEYYLISVKLPVATFIPVELLLTGGKRTHRLPALRR
jgi:hypothetical protein